MWCFSLRSAHGRRHACACVLAALVQVACGAGEGPIDRAPGSRPLGVSTSPTPAVAQTPTSRTSQPTDLEIALPRVPRVEEAFEPAEVSAELWITTAAVRSSAQGQPLDPDAVRDLFASRASDPSSKGRRRIRLHVDEEVSHQRLQEIMEAAQTARFEEAEFAVLRESGSPSQLVVVVVRIPPRRVRVVSNGVSNVSVAVHPDGSATTGVGQLADEERVLAGPVVPVRSSESCPAPAREIGPSLERLVGTLCTRRGTESLNIDFVADPETPAAVLIPLLARRPWPRRCSGTVSLALGIAGRAASRVRCEDAVAMGELEEYFERQLAIAAERAAEQSRPDAPLPPDDPELDALLEDLDPEDFKALGKALESGAATGHLGLGELGPPPSPAPRDTVQR